MSTSLMFARSSFKSLTRSSASAARFVHLPVAGNQRTSHVLLVLSPRLPPLEDPAVLAAKKSVLAANQQGGSCRQMINAVLAANQQRGSCRQMINAVLAAK